MTSGRSGRTASWIAAIVAVVLLFGSGATAYSDLKSDLTGALTRVGALEKEDVSLDRYDIRLSEDVDDLNDRMIRSEAEQEGIKKTQARIEFTMNEMLKEMKEMNENLIRGLANATR